MGLSPEHFWKLTPREWELQVGAYREQQQRLDYRAALICSTIANTVLRPAELFVPEDFMPVYQAEASCDMSEEDRVAAVKSLAIAMGAEFNENGGESRG